MENEAEMTGVPATRRPKQSPTVIGNHQLKVLIGLRLESSQDGTEGIRTIVGRDNDRGLHADGDPPGRRSGGCVGNGQCSCAS